MRGISDLPARINAEDVGRIQGDPVFPDPVGGEIPDIALLNVCVATADNSECKIFAPGSPSIDMNFAPNKPSVYALGHPLGLPATLAGCASADWKPHMAATSLDVNVGSSGSPVFDAQTHALVGVVSAGAPTVDWDHEQNCYHLEAFDGSQRDTMVTTLRSLKSTLKKPSPRGRK